MKRLLIISVFLTVTYCASAQIIVSEDTLFNFRIKLVESFMERFNSGENIVPLFDQEMLGSDTQTVKDAEDFSKVALKSGAKLKYADTTWFAIAPCSGKLNGKSVEFVLILNVEKYAKDQYKWVIVKAEGNIFKLSSPANDKTIITPLAHETNFMELARLRPSAIMSVSHKRYELDPTAVFFTLYHTKQLTIEYITNLQFMFFQVPGYVLTIKEFDRQTKNAGWLITSIEKMNEKDKNNLLKSLNYEK